MKDKTQECIETDVLVIGCGIAGGTATLQLADSGVTVTVITRSKEPKETNTYYAQGGIIYQSEDDSPELLVEDIIRAGAGLCDTRAVRLLAERGPDLVREILIGKIGVTFDHTGHDEFSLALEGGHSVSRVVHAADTTGRAIETALLKKLLDHPNVTLLANHTAVNLLTPAHHARNRLAIYEQPSCVGAYILDQDKGRVIRCLAKCTILATGGLGQIFLRTTNPPGARGDGLAMAYRAGARVINAEFIQFHPTTLYHPQAPPFLISEAVRGEGARLVDAKGEPFMQKYSSEWKDLAPRDIVARSMHHEMLEQDTTHVYLDLHSYISTERIHEHFPNIYETCLAYGIDITHDLVPVVPGAHYSCGGVWVDEWGHTSIQHLYAVGEVSCTGLHGANRLASSSLLEALVWGDQAACHILSHITTLPIPDREDIPPWQETGTSLPDPALISHDMYTIRHIMWNYVGLVRTTRRLDWALRKLRHLETDIEQFYQVSRLSDGLIGLRNAVRSAIIVTAAAWENKNSVGCHYRE
ncbi:MAG: L-aspartate oxidase [Anaerolineae bacterium]|nr:L-aspartate oxidase [Anaerolineae bacterium]